MTIIGYPSGENLPYGKRFYKRDVWFCTEFYMFENTFYYCKQLGYD